MQDDQVVDCRPLILIQLFSKFFFWLRLKERRNFQQTEQVTPIEIKYLLLWQLPPLYPGLQLQTYLFTWSTHVPPLTQGLLEHLVMSTWIQNDTTHKVNIIEQLESQQNQLQAGQLKIHLKINKVLHSLTIHSGVSSFAVTNKLIHLVNTRPSV